MNPLDVRHASFFMQLSSSPSRYPKPVSQTLHSPCWHSRHPFWHFLQIFRSFQYPDGQRLLKMHFPWSSRSSIPDSERHDLQNALSTAWQVAHGAWHDKLGSSPERRAAIMYWSCGSSNARYSKLKRREVQRHDSFGFIKFSKVYKLMPRCSWNT